MTLHPSRVTLPSMTTNSHRAIYFSGGAFYRLYSGPYNDSGNCLWRLFRVDETVSEEPFLWLYAPPSKGVYDVLQSLAVRPETLPTITAGLLRRAGLSEQTLTDVLSYGVDRLELTEEWAEQVMDSGAIPTGSLLDLLQCLGWSGVARCSSGDTMFSLYYGALHSLDGPALLVRDQGISKRYLCGQELAE